MKILLLFVDMLRPNLLHTWNEKNERNRLDDWMERIGGTVYTNCFTPGPDTPRSQACVWTSRYPKFNGCNTRIKWPLRFLQNPQNNFFHVLQDHGYQLNFFIHPSYIVSGELPENFTGNVNYSEDKSLLQFLDELEVADNSLTTFFFRDYHYSVDDYYASYEAHRVGVNNIMDCFDLIDDKIGLNSFDYLLVYSDHGFSLNTDIHNKIEIQLSENRTNVFLFTREKNDKDLIKDDHLCTVMDIGPTLCKKAGFEIPYQIDGKMLSCSTYKYVVINDHKTFGVEVNQPIEYWAVKTTDGFYFTDTDQKWYSKRQISPKLREELIAVLEKYGDEYRDNKIATDVLECYKKMKITTPNFYLNGKPRIKHIPMKIGLHLVIKKILPQPIIKLIQTLKN